MPRVHLGLAIMSALFLGVDLAQGRGWLVVVWSLSLAANAFATVGSWPLPERSDGSSGLSVGEGTKR